MDTFLKNLHSDLVGIGYELPDGNYAYNDEHVAICCDIITEQLTLVPDKDNQPALTKIPNVNRTILMCKIDDYEVILKSELTRLKKLKGFLPTELIE